MYYLNRTMCAVLDEMRDLTKVLHDSNVNLYVHIIKMLIEEVQVMGNKMEAKLADIKDVENMQQRAKELSKEIKNLIKEKKKLGGKDNFRTIDFGG